MVQNVRMVQNVLCCDVGASALVECDLLAALLAPGLGGVRGMLSQGRTTGAALGVYWLGVQ